MDNAAVTRCVGGYYVWLAFGDSESLRSSEGHNLRITLHDSRSSEHVVSRGLKFGGQSQRRISFNRPIMATDDSSSSRSSDYAVPYIIKPDRQELIKQKGCVIWITGLSGSALYNRGKLSYILDGDNVRHGLNSDLSFKAEDRAENVRRVGEVAKLFADAGIICIASLISPYRKERAACRALLPEGDLLRFCNNAEYSTAWTLNPICLTSSFVLVLFLFNPIWMCHSMFVKLETQRAYTSVHALAKSKVASASFFNLTQLV
ncbi:hypothetical protein HID58_032306 [Brassica napus]|uniref:APS kinase domain-containing protein n=1 Tax=Brassica napus TaxID=3708 RepID=A0ABQ8BVZ6_BRANA|nr:hypothetical protein HID58_032306 [Brassica napus]